LNINKNFETYSQIKEKNIKNYIKFKIKYL